MIRLVVMLALGIQICIGQNIAAGNYSWPQKLDKSASEKSGSMISGKANALEQLNVIAHSVNAGQSLEFNDLFERVIFIRSGTASVSMKDSTWSVGRGSVIIIMPDEPTAISNHTSSEITFHEMKYKSKLPVEIDRGKLAGGSFVVDWNKTVFKPHERGGVRSFFNRPTAMSKRFEMHVTTLNGNTSSHEPHTHAAEEIILLLEGEADMLIGDKHYQAKAGDLFFVPTQLLHGIKNISPSQCSYYAYQWE